jgi:hypothetical protein
MDPARIEGRVLAFGGFGLTIGVADVSSAWPVVLAITMGVLAFGCVAPGLWYGSWFVVNFLGFAPPESRVSAQAYRRRCAACRRQCRLLAARLDALVIRVEASAEAATAGGNRWNGGRHSAYVRDLVLRSYEDDEYEDWLIDILREAWELGASVPASIKTRVAAKTVVDLRVLSSVIRDLEEELSATGDRPAL